jgi:hypothetical protein
MPSGMSLPSSDTREDLNWSSYHDDIIDSFEPNIDMKLQLNCDVKFILTWWRMWRFGWNGSVEISCQGESY